MSVTRVKPGRRNRALIWSVYNAYNNESLLRAGHQPDGTRVIREYGLFPIIPSVAWRFHF